MTPVLLPPGCHVPLQVHPLMAGDVLVEAPWAVAAASGPPEVALVPIHWAMQLLDSVGGVWIT